VRALTRKDISQLTNSPPSYRYSQHLYAHRHYPPPPQHDPAGQLVRVGKARGPPRSGLQLLLYDLGTRTDRFFTFLEQLFSYTFDSGIPNGVQLSSWSRLNRRYIAIRRHLSAVSNQSLIPHKSNPTRRDVGRTIEQIFQLLTVY